MSAMAIPRRHGRVSMVAVDGDGAGRASFGMAGGLSAGGGAHASPERVNVDQQGSARSWRVWGQMPQLLWIAHGPLLPRSPSLASLLSLLSLSLHGAIYYFDD